MTQIQGINTGQSPIKQDVNQRISIENKSPLRVKSREPSHGPSKAFAEPSQFGGKEIAFNMNRYLHTESNVESVDPRNRLRGDLDANRRSMDSR